MRTVEKSFDLGPPQSSRGPVRVFGRLRDGLLILLSLLSLVLIVQTRNPPLLEPSSWASWLDAQHDSLFYSSMPPAAHFLKEVCPQQAAYAGPAPDVSIPEQQELAERLSKAVQHDTSVLDGWPSPSDDPVRWQDKFGPFREYMRQTYPRMHADEGPVKLELINEHGLLYTWTGSDEGLKPVLLMAHQDVVPVNPETVDSWLHPPFKGVIDEHQMIWGRGSYDAKAWLVSISSTIEALLASDHTPKRTIVISFGFDEEASGPQGAKRIGAVLHERYGNESFAMVVDEGTPLLGPEDTANPVRVPMAMAAVAEKGSLQIAMTVRSPGGHSSGAPPHTSIGFLAHLLTAVEDSPRFGPIILGGEHDSAYLALRCYSDSATFPAELRSRMNDLDWALLHRRSGRGGRQHDRYPDHTRSFGTRARGLLAQLSDSDRRADRRVTLARNRVEATLEHYPTLRNPTETTRAIDIISGGIKVNALPESAQGIIDHRIALLSTSEELKAIYRDVVTPVAHKYGLVPTFWNVSVPLPKGVVQKGELEVKDFHEGSTLEPAPATPLGGADAAPWRLFSSVIRRVWEDEAAKAMRAFSDGENGEQQHVDGVRVIPSPMQGNTDTRYMWRLSKHIFRFGPSTLQKDTSGLGSATTGIHTVNEHYPAKGLYKSVEFYATLLAALDEHTEL